MKRIVSLSGGIGSYITAKRVFAKYPKNEIELVFCDTLYEDGDLYRFLEDIEKKFDTKIIRLCVGITPLELAFAKKFLWNSRIASCSVELKSKPFREYLKTIDDDIIIYMGIDWSEQHRCEKITKNYAPYKVEYPLCEPPYLFKQEFLNELDQDGIKQPRLYQIGLTHNNCGGRCVKAGIGHYKILLEKDKNRYLELENMEQAFRLKYGKDVSILKRGGNVFTLKELRQIIETAPKQLTIDDYLDFGGCSCFSEE